MAIEPLELEWQGAACKRLMAERAKETPEQREQRQRAEAEWRQKEDEVRWQKIHERQREERIFERDMVEGIMDEESVDGPTARMLYEYRFKGGTCLPEHKVLQCEELERALARTKAERIVADANRPIIDWDKADHEREQRPPRQDGNGQGQPQPEGPGSLDEWNAGTDPGKIPPRRWLLGNQFCRGFISSIVAAGGTGKSALRLLQFIALATGRKLSGEHVFQRSRVLLISLEDDRDELQRRIQGVLDHYGIARSELDGWLYCANPKLAKLAEMKNRERKTGPLEQQIRDAVARCKPDVISLDPFIKTHSLEENDNVDMDFVCDLLARLAIEHNVAVDSPHHVHKGQVSPGDADAGRGASGIKDAGRLVYTLVPMSEDEASMLGISPADRPSYVRLDSAKVNIVARSTKATWFRITGKPIENGDDDYPSGDTVQVVDPWEPPSAWAGTTIEALNQILTDIDRGIVDDDGNPTGQRYSNAPAAKEDRAVWPVVQKYYPDKPEALCRTIINTWLDNKLLYPKEYNDPVLRKPRKGLYVDDAKRPS
jgi:hypothetical protein